MCLSAAHRTHALLIFARNPLIKQGLTPHRPVHGDRCESSYDTWVSVYDINGNRRYSCDDCGEDDCGNERDDAGSSYYDDVRDDDDDDSCCRTVATFDLEAGDYVLLIDGYACSQGNYSFTVECANYDTSDEDDDDYDDDDYEDDDDSDTKREVAWYLGRQMNCCNGTATVCSNDLRNYSAICIDPSQYTGDTIALEEGNSYSFSYSLHSTL